MVKILSKTFFKSKEKIKKNLLDDSYTAVNMLVVGEEAKKKHMGSLWSPTLGVSSPVRPVVLVRGSPCSLLWVDDNMID